MYVYALKMKEKGRDCNFETIAIFGDEDSAECEMNAIKDAEGEWYDFEIERFMLDESPECFLL